MLDIPQLPVMAPTSLTSLKLAPRLPLTKVAGTEPLSMTGTREQEILNYMAAMKGAFAETKIANDISKERAKAKDRAMQRAAER
jgi:hypothetical protein